MALWNGTNEDEASAENTQKVTRTLHGLKNQGATCYLNSVLQVLFMTTELHERLDPKSHTDKVLRKLFDKLENQISETKNITKTFGIKNVHQQRDAAECLEMILNKVSPEASQVFKGELKYSTTCSECHNINTETNPFLTLPLSLKDDNSSFNVESDFDNIFQTKSFTGDNLVYCEQCEKRTKATSECEMVTFPRILVLLLKSFDFDINTMSYFKSDRCVEMPHTLQRENHTYKLCGIVNHWGWLKGGHYTATILCNEDQAWYEFDNSHVKKLEEQLFAGNAETYRSSAAYLLVYRGFEDPSVKLQAVCEHQCPYVRLPWLVLHRISPFILADGSPLARAYAAAIFCCLCIKAHHSRERSIIHAFGTMKTRFLAIFPQALEMYHNFEPRVITCAFLINICLAW